MTGLLKETMRERAEAQSAPTIDVEGIIRSGDRRVRRGRLTTGLAAVGVAGVIAAGAMVVPQLIDSSGTPGGGHVAGQDSEESTAPYAERKLTFATEDVVYYGRESFSVGVTVTSYVQTDDALVVTSSPEDGAAEVVWRYNGADAMRIGHADGNVLRADDTGSLVAWTDSSGGSTEYVVFDTSTESEVARVRAATAPGEGPEIFAVDDGAAYWRLDDGIVRYDVETGTSETVSRWKPVDDPAHKPAQVYDIVDVAEGQIAYLEDGPRGTQLMVGEAVGDEARQMPSGWNGVLSSDGRYIGVEEADELAVYETTTGADVTPQLDDYPFKVVYGWVDEDTAMVLAIKDLQGKRFPSDFLTCEIPEGTCDVVWAGVDAGLRSLTLPVGDPMDS
ncbi:MAG TPA: hypothetical protein VLB29_03360 [Nocardioidaceae bacterium]|nr:hypothetical protein [Nocardioidaceae bacterium]